MKGSDNLDQTDPLAYCSIVCESTHFPRVGAALASYSSCFIKGIRAAHLFCEAILSFPKENTNRTWNKSAWQVEMHQLSCISFGHKGLFLSKKGLFHAEISF